MNPVVKRNIAKLAEVTENIKNITDTTERTEISILLAEFEKLTRKEKSIFYKIFIQDNKLVNKIIKLANIHTDCALLADIISALGNMVVRYKITATDELYDLFFNLRENKHAHFYIPLFIFHFPQFKNDDRKWNYLLTIPRIPPKKKSERNLFTIIKYITLSGEVIPNHYKEEIINILKKMASKSMYNDEYLSLIAKLSKF
ncbi:hypothetical protein JYG55_00800 [Escherichia fergusonii]|uniref:hypothetical protein n=1 Tax=Escherichia fergusonii TaxID=564 RepID=UPI001CBF0BD5|nr:hypothetical protein [Escherichia fergusonii]MBZ4137347.1 hypothetical protein [Escherichia fergusonii]MBZ4171184.1 hypothetical protein [Escherichia fergusonii]UAW37923.1 hypothetical protein JW961_15230 [Escherichia fergusonii]